MRELFPFKKVGDPLEASHVNRLSEVARRISSGFASAGMNGTDGFWNPEPSLTQNTVVVTDGSGTLMGTEALDADGNDTNQLKVRQQYWHEKDPEDDEDQDEWRERDDDTKFNIDVKAVKVGLEKGDVLNAFWNHQRNQYIALPTDRQNTVIPIRNDTGSTLQKYDIVGIKGVVVNEPPNLNFEEEIEFEETKVLDRFQDQVCLVADKAHTKTDDEDIYKNKFAVVQSNIDTDKIGWAIIQGLAVVRLFLDEAEDEFADIYTVEEDGDDLPEFKDHTADENLVIPLKSSSSGSFRIVWKERDTVASEDTRWMWAIGILGGSVSKTMLRARLDEELTANSSALATLYDRNSDGKFVLTTEQETVHADILASGESIQSGANIWIAEAYKVWWVIDAKCVDLVESS